MTVTRRRSCDGKRRFDSKPAAEEHLTFLIRGGTSPARMNVYKCRFCGGFHVGHRPRRRR